MKSNQQVTKILRSNCPVAGTLDIIGDRWTLLIIRDLLHGKHRYGEFLESDESIPTNILANRLKTLEKENVIKKVWYSEHPPRAEYHLTEIGEELGEVVMAMFAWGNKNLAAKLYKNDNF